MSEYTTIQLSKSVVNDLKKLKMHPRQSFDDVISNLLKSKSAKDDYFKLMMNAQKIKMREVWDNKEDEKWEKLRPKSGK
ncbi:MAG TPA: antitoxin VapB family protein [archaeon]|jgi:predicted CopG family antitoxin|nr:antitoxin VapB family protein [archaeon]HPV66023.1 antitoxin VapB family protein [archaeon]HRS42343.1 antitoxin VapB family protein [Candidatus Diapherotrites archaeon]